MRALGLTLSGPMELVACCLLPPASLTISEALNIVKTPAKVAQLVEHSSEKAGVAGSSPALGTTLYPLSSQDH